MTKRERINRKRKLGENQGNMKHHTIEQSYMSSVKVTYSMVFCNMRLSTSVEVRPDPTLYGAWNYFRTLESV